MAQLIEAVDRALAHVPAHGDFFASGADPISSMRMNVAHVGPLSWPLSPRQAEQIVAIAQRAPYGRGDRTLYDDAVRRTWQLGPDDLGLYDAAWERSLRAIVASAAKGLGVQGPVRAKLYKLLIYDEESFFGPHRDTEKVAGMFATLVVTLPSPHEGGDLVIRHEGREVVLKLSDAAVDRVRWAAFYADCEHEVRPITQGHRLVLVYNLVRSGAAGKTKLVAPRSSSRGLTDALQAWANSDEPPTKLVYVLAHRYSTKGVSIAALKNGDAARAQALLDAARHASCGAWLAMLSIEEQGSAEEEYAPSRRRWERAAPRFLAGDVDERTQVCESFRDRDDVRTDLAPVPFDDAEVCPAHALSDLKPDDEYFHEQTGNEGASFQRTYRRAAIVVWPERRDLFVAAQRGITVASSLAAMPVEEARIVARALATRWPATRWHDRRETALRDQLLAAFIRCDDAAALASFLSTGQGFADHSYDGAENATLLRAWKHLDRALLAPGLAAFISRFFSGQSAKVAALVGGLLADGDAAARPIAAACVDALARPHSDPWRREIDGPAVVAVFAALGAHGDADLARRAGAAVLANPQRYPLDAVVVPLALAGGVARDRLDAVARSHLEARSALPLEAPTDWVIPGTMTCHSYNCRDCAAVAEFLRDPKAQTLAFKAAEHRRDHVKRGLPPGVDVDATLQHLGNPKTLLFRKTRASYERRVAERASDLDLLARLA